MIIMLAQVGFVGVLVVLAQVLPHLYGCVLLLNGWTPVSVRDRAQLAEVVFSGIVLRAFKEQRTSAKTYSAEVEIIKVYKGISLLQQASSKNVYNISNFGDKPACYADVFEGEQYIFFLTLFEKRLSAKYDDIFGATADFSLENEDEVLAAQGWDSWSSWSACSRSCRHGQRTRQRTCQLEQKQCEGKESEQKPCNMFPCNSVNDMLDILGVKKLPPGVLKSVDRAGAYQISSSAQLNSPTSGIFQGRFPVNFSILLGLNLSPEFAGYVFTVSDSMQHQKIGIYYRNGEWRFEYSDQDGLPGVASPVFVADLADGLWHSISFSVQGQEITMFYDCENNITKSFLRTRWPLITVNSVMSIGPFFKRNGVPFEGGIEQLVISEDPHSAERQCGDWDMTDSMDSEKMSGDSREMTTPLTTTTTTKHSGSDSGSVMFQWSAWSPCSVSCGRGLKTRTLFCKSNQVEPSVCIPRHIPRHQARRCSPGACPGKCRLPCLNGGVCDGTGRCVCGLGYSGEQCERATCYPGCYNGGRCVNPYFCHCQPGYTGALCEAALCDPPCRNGGYCISPGQCSCPYGYLAPDCAPFCQTPCLNGGSCVGPDICLCPSGYSGSRCEQAVCDGGCLNGGRCVGPNRCHCRYGYSGSKCEQAMCSPPCQNGGVCEKPFVCSCKPGTIGWYCEHFTCSKPCKNGGVCSGPDKCTCPAGFRGSRCQKRACGGGCLNGGRCVKKRKCKCLQGFKGKRCQKKKCRIEGNLEPYAKSYLRSVREHFATRCGPWNLQPCVRTRLKYVRVSREIFRAVFRCK